MIPGGQFHISSTLISLLTKRSSHFPDEEDEAQRAEELAV